MKPTIKAIQNFAVNSMNYFFLRIALMGEKFSESVMEELMLFLREMDSFYEKAFSEEIYELVRRELTEGVYTSKYTISEATARMEKTLLDICCDPTPALLAFYTKAYTQAYTENQRKLEEK